MKDITSPTDAAPSAAPCRPGLGVSQYATPKEIADQYKKNSRCIDHAKIPPQQLGARVRLEPAGGLRDQPLHGGDRPERPDRVSGLLPPLQARPSLLHTQRLYPVQCRAQAQWVYHVCASLHAYNENSPQYIKPVVDPVAKPLAGFEHLTKINILVSTKAKPNGGTPDTETYSKTYSMPNEVAVKATDDTVTELDCAMAHE
ncbi:WD repeat and FYVE domain-containing protein 1 [Phytophthora pseudosyringae]|uniref:WD repeat and FYVE domain-containing protein 1 n=1 Tax=Phytophthora pseudosyringae TaxID=221518 RepID=A0A8T1V6G2_9STRA|nr:WD repeat and FYVE domain-containing protein 1 [Phytophthora pseudosyringae]